MKQVHVCNVFFEQELEQIQSKRKALSLRDWIYSHPMYMQLQFLPLLYSGKNDFIAVTDLPENSDSRLVSFQNLIEGTVNSWAPSCVVYEFFQEKQLLVSVPEMSIVQKIQSKAFSWNQGMKLPGSCLLQTYEEVQSFLQQEGKKVLKSLYGASGRGHFFPHKGGDVNRFLQPQFYSLLPVLGEPWMDRILDFSTQWFITKQTIELLGVTQIENSVTGSYMATNAGFDFNENSWAIRDHLEYVKPVLQQIQSMGFFGHLGIDAFVYQLQGKKYLHPLGEINARKTMSYVALMVQQKRCPGKRLRFCFTKNKTGLLPEKLYVLGREIKFSHNIQLQFEF